jgi:hypothetical protein
MIHRGVVCGHVRLYKHSYPIWCNHIHNEVDSHTEHPTESHISQSSLVIHGVFPLVNSLMLA